MKKVKQTPEERKAKQKLAGEIYRNSWSPERRAEVNEQKRLYGLKNKEKLAEKRKLYYETNKEQMQANSKTYHQQVRDEIAAKRAAGIEVIIKKQIRAPRVRKVIAQPSNMATIKEIAKSLELLTNKFREMISDPIYNFPKPAMIRIDGVDLYEIVEVGEWIQQHKEAITYVTITGAIRKKTGITISKRVMLVTAWLQASKHVTKYCNAQRVAINSNQFWSRWA